MSKNMSGGSKCGWCITGEHDDCKPEIKYFDKVWLCSCETCHGVIQLEIQQQGESNE